MVALVASSAAASMMVDTFQPGKSCSQQVRLQILDAMDHELPGSSGASCAWFSGRVTNARHRGLALNLLTPYCSYLWVGAE